MSAALSQLERDRLIERTKAGLKSAKARGRTGGRKPKLTSEQIEMAKGLLASGKAPRDVAKAFGVGRSTLYRYVPGDTSTADEDDRRYDPA
jgi:DNA invertase Pin-like site-specific DNA recombinase